MLKILFSYPHIGVSHETLSFSVEAKQGLDCSIGFANSRGEHKMLDFAVEKVRGPAGEKVADIKFMIKELQENGFTKTVKEFTLHLKENDRYEFSELE